LKNFRFLFEKYPVHAGKNTVAPRLRATGLPCIATPEIKSSGNTQQLGTENNRFIDL
jgi:hypothetical protein